MSKNQIACCPGCGDRIPFKQFIELNNLSATNCGNCNTRITISNRAANALLAGISVIVSTATVLTCTYLGQKNFDSVLGGLCSGICMAAILFVSICSYAYRHSRLNRISRL